jgi:nitronate monooxygenase
MAETYFGLQRPVILAPMAGGPGTAELAAAVANAGGMASIGAAYLLPDQIGGEILRVRGLTRGALNVNLFAGGYVEDGAADAEAMLEILRGVHAELGIDPPAAPPPARNPFPEQLEAVLEARPEVFSFTFGIPDRDAIARLRSRGIAVFGTATTLAEGRMLAEAGVDAIVAQGAEAGAHRGTFAGPFEESMVPTLDLVRGLAGTAPVIASGGIMDGRDIARMLENGARAVQLGTAFLACPESGAAPAYKRAIVEARRDSTVITRAFSGRPARGLLNAFIERIAGKESAILPFPMQNTMTRAMRAAAAKRGDPGYLSLWAGQGVARARALPAGELMEKLMEEMAASSTEVARKIH